MTSSSIVRMLCRCATVVVAMVATAAPAVAQVGNFGTSPCGTPQSTGAFIAGEQEKWRALAQELGIQPQ